MTYRTRDRDGTRDSPIGCCPGLSRLPTGHGGTCLALSRSVPLSRNGSMSHDINQRGRLCAAAQCKHVDHAWRLLRRAPGSRAGGLRRERSAGANGTGTGTPDCGKRRLDTLRCHGAAGRGWGACPCRPGPGRTDRGARRAGRPEPLADHGDESMNGSRLRGGGSRFGIDDQSGYPDRYLRADFLSQD